MMPDWLLGGRGVVGSGFKLFFSESIHVIFQSLLESVGCVREVSLGHATLPRIM